MISQGDFFQLSCESFRKFWTEYLTSLFTTYLPYIDVMARGAGTLVHFITFLKESATFLKTVGIKNLLKLYCERVFIEMLTKASSKYFFSLIERLVLQRC
jgi:hypothetical protein